MLSLSLSFLLVCRVLSASGVFEMPESAEAALCEVAEFRCRATGVHSLDWLIDGRVASHTDITARGITYHTVLQNGAIQSVLSVSGTVQNNGTTVQCETFTRPNKVQQSPPVFLSVQGVLESPTDLKVEYRDRDVIRLGWKLPLTCAGLHIQSINLYHNEHNSRDVNVITLPGELTSYDFRADSSNPDPCLQYYFHVSATNNFRESNASEVISGSFLSDPVPVDTAAVVVAVEFTQESMTTVTFTFPVIPIVMSLRITMNRFLPLNSENAQAALCPGKNAEHYTVNMTCSSAVFSELKPQVSTQQNKTVVEFQASPEVLPLNNLYQTVITSTNSLGSVENHEGIKTSTFDVQNATVSVQERSGQFCLHCVFASGSSARGCVAEIHEQEIKFSQTSLRQHDSNGLKLIASSCGKFSARGSSYEVLVFDLEEDGTQSDEAALTLLLQVSGKDYDSDPETAEKDDKSSFESPTSIVVVVIGGFVLCLVISLILVAAVIVLLRKRQKQRKGNEEGIYDEIPEHYTKHEDDMQPKVADNVAYGHINAAKV